MSVLPTKPNVPPKKPDNLKFARAFFSYKAREPDELTFQEGDLVRKRLIEK